MYRVFLIDDEPWAMVTLEHLIDWDSLGFRVEEKIDNARRAWERIQQERPDVIVTDIRMPGLSGLDLLGRIHDAQLPVKVVLVSAFADFTYAQEAIRQGAVEYLLKPVHKEHLLTCMSRLSARLKMADQPVAAGQAVLASCKYAREAYEAIGGEKAPEGTRMAALLCKGDAHLHLREAMAAEGHFVHADLGQETYVFVCALAGNDRGLAARLTHACGKALQPGSFGIAFQQEETEPLENLIWHAKAAQATARFIGVSGLENPAANAAYDREVELIKAVQYNQREMIITYLEALKNYVASGRLMLDRLFALLRGIDRFYRQSSGGRALFSSEWKDYLDVVKDFPTEEALFTYLNGVFALDDEEKWMVTVLEEIEQNYACSKTLSAIGQELGISQGALSQLIRKHTGKTYSELIQEKRMEKARELLCYTDATVAAIAEEIGYSDQFYFSKLFKKLFGQSPNAYRKKVRSGNEITKS